VGLHGFALGGLIVEGGHRGDGEISPLIARMAFPADWSVLVIVPTHEPGLHGPDEVRAFAALPPIPESETDRLCRLVLLGILPAVAERDLDGFGQALEELQLRVGLWFAPAQGGVFAGPRLEAIAGWLRGRGVRGVGQSSWGPTLYGFSAEGAEWRDALSRRFSEQFGEGSTVLWTGASAEGHSVSTRVHASTSSSSPAGSTGIPL
jgi:beta-RFAP synthase